jgi:hypothetical protein
MPLPHLTPGKDTVLIIQEAELASGPVWTGAENFASTWIRSPDRPARRQSLYRLSYPGPLKETIKTKIMIGDIAVTIRTRNFLNTSISLSDLSSLLWRNNFNILTKYILFNFLLQQSHNISIGN